MSMLRRRGSWVALMGVAVLASAAWGAGTNAPDADVDIHRLESLLRAQQEKIETLNRQAAAFQDDDADQARAEMMRQQIREVLSDQEFRESLMPSTLQAGWDKGFFIRSSDDRFKMYINGRMQFRWTHYQTRTQNRWLQPRLQRNDRTGFDIRRIRLMFRGHIYSEDLTYLFKLQADSPTGYNFQVIYWYLNYRFTDEFQMRFGVFQTAGTRASARSSANMQFTEYPVVDAVFGTGIGLGVRFWGQAFDKRLEYMFDVVNSMNGNGRTITTDPPELDNNPLIGVRVVWHACGESPTTDFVEWADREFNENPCVDLGFHYVFNEDDGDLRTTRIPYERDSFLPGGFGLTRTNGIQVHQFGLEAAMKWRGFSAAGEYIARALDVRRARRTPFTPLWLLTGEDSTTFMHGGYVQMGYFLPIPGWENKLEAVGRVGGILTNASGSEGTWTYSAGFNYYIEGNKVKLQADVLKITEVPISANSWMANVNDDALIFRVQLQVAF